MSLNEFFKPSKLTGIILLNYGLFLLLLGFYLAILLFVGVNILSNGALAYRMGFTFIIIILLIVYILVQLLVYWFKRYKSKKVWWLIKSIGALLSLGVIVLTLNMLAFNTPKPRALSRNVANVKQIQTALELYYFELKSYPSEVLPGQAISSGAEIYMSIVPSLLPNAGKCPADYEFVYQANNEVSTYKIIYCLWDEVAGLKPGYHVATPESVSAEYTPF